MKKLLAMMLTLALVLGMGVVPAGAQGETVSLFYGGGTPLSIDPALNSASSGSNVIKLAFTGLMGYQFVDGEPTLSPELAESYTVSDDLLTYTFTLREGLKWSDGSDFFASDVEKSWKRAASADLGADYGFLYDVVAGYADGELAVVADDAARTVTVTLAGPCKYFLDLCAFPTFYPVKTDLADAEGAWATKVETYIGTGAFRMTKYAVDDVIAFEKNPNYWNADAVSLAGVNCYLSEDNVAILTAYENGTAQFINSIDPTEYPRLQAAYPGELNFGPYIGTWYVLFNVHKDLSPAGKTLTVQEQSRARFALGQMVNRQDLVEYVTQGGQQAATGFYPAGLTDGKNADVRAAEGYGVWYEGTATPSDVNDMYTADMAEALATLVDLGYAYTGTIEGGDIMFTDFPTIEFAFNNSGANALIMQYVQEIWNSVGITGVINTEAWSTLQSKLKDGDAESARMGWIADFNDCVNFLEIFISNSGNNYPRLGKDVGTYSRFTDNTKDAGVGAYWGIEGNQTWAECYDALVQAIKAEGDADKRAEMCAQAEEILMATGAVAPMYFYTNPYMMKTNLKNVIMLSTGDVYWTYATVE